MVFPPPFFLFLSLFLSVSGGSGVLSHGAVFGLGFLFISFSFLLLWTLGLFLNIEDATALLHMSTYIAERWHRAHGLLYVLGC